MKRYIILAATLQKMGGAQNYLQSKLRWLREQGWVADIIFYKEGPVMLPYLKDCHYCVEELKHPTYYYNSRRREKICDKLLSIVCDNIYEQTVIESTIVDLSTWGEILASKLNAKHFIFSLQETDIISNHSMADYIRFKYERRELAGITDASVGRMLASFGMTIPEEKSYKLLAYMQDVLEDYEHPLTGKIREMTFDYTIGSIGRLEKPFVMPTINAIIDYVKADSKHQYLLLLIGDAAKGCENRKQIEELCNTIPNITLLITGYLYPIPVELVRTCDVFFSSSGSAGVSVRCGVPTVSIDGKDFKPIGVVGYTTNSRLFRTTEPVRPIAEYLNETLKDKKYPKASFHPMPQPDYTNHMQFIEQSNNIVEYYDISKLKWNKEQRLQRMLMPILGPKVYHVLISDSRNTIHRLLK